VLPFRLRRLSRDKGSPDLLGDGPDLVEILANDEDAPVARRQIENLPLDVRGHRVPGVFAESGHHLLAGKPCGSRIPDGTTSAKSMRTPR
jgi:hypothetical protein